MLYTVEIPLHLPTGMQARPDMGSLLQGAIMEIIDDDAAYKLHRMQLRPYTQCVYYDKKRQQSFWRLTSIHLYGYTAVIQPLLAYSKPIYLRQRRVTISLGMPQVEQLPYKALADITFQGPYGPRGVDITFLTPTSFKHNGAYDILPDIGRCYGSLLAKWNCFASEISLEQDGLAEELASQCIVTKFHLDSQPFGVEGIAIQGFVGTMRLHFRGNDMIRRLQGLLWNFAPFSGIGIKNAMGMGAVATRLRQ